MNRGLREHSKIILNSNGRPVEFYVDEVLGFGVNCVAYRVFFREGQEGHIMHRGVLKEYVPSYLEIQREEGSLIVPEKSKADFQNGKQHFKDVYIQINRYLNENTMAQMFHPVQLCFLEGETSYTLVSCDEGIRYDRVSEERIEEVLERMVAITTAVSHFHQAGYLVLDIKESNILISPEFCNLVKLYDYDSITPMSAIEQWQPGDRIEIPIPREYYIPELRQLNVRNITPATDVFELGALLYGRIFGNFPTMEQMQNGAKRNYEEVRMLKHVSDKFLQELDKVFQQTLQISPRLRYPNAETLKKHLKHLLEIAKRERIIAEWMDYQYKEKFA